MTTSYAPGRPAWIDLGSTDVAATIAFYGQLFGWQADGMGPDSGGYGLFRQAGRKVAGYGPATDPTRGTSWSLYFATPDADESESRVAAAGGTVVVPAGDVLDQGRMGVFQDPSGAYFSVWQAGEHKGMEVSGEPGSLSWVELYSTDVDAVKGFYATVLGVGTRDIPEIPYTVFEIEGERIAGAMASPDGASRWTVYFEVADCDAVADRALELGAGELMRHDSPAGKFSFLIDPQGAFFAIITSNPDFTV